VSCNNPSSFINNRRWILKLSFKAAALGALAALSLGVHAQSWNTYGGDGSMPFRVDRDIKLDVW
jgi:hypothetical protein